MPEKQIPVNDTCAIIWPVWLLSVYQSYLSVCDCSFSLSIDVAGLLVGRLKGRMVRATEPLGRSDQLVDADTIIGEKY